MTGRDAGDITQNALDAFFKSLLPGGASGAVGAGHAHIEDAHRNDAIEQAKQILLRDSKNVNAYRNLSRLYFAKGEYKTRTLDRTIGCHWSFMHENLMDMNHQFLHRSVLGRIRPELLGYDTGGVPLTAA